LSSRRDFFWVAGVTVVSLGAMLTGCSSDGGTSPTTPLLSTKGTLDGLLVNVQGTPQGNFGTLILMYPTGQHVGMTIAPDANGKFGLADLPAGDYQLRFQAAGQAIVPEPYQHPIKFAIDAGKTTQLTVRIQRGSFAQNQVEIYCGDDFFQAQPDGPENGETIVPVGTVVCWYNVGRKVHTVTGGPWNDSGDLQRTQSYIWVATVPGVHAYRCTYNQPGMRATLRVVGR
jgi:hypothetical protein